MLVHCPYCPQAFDAGPQADTARLRCPSCARSFNLAERQTRTMAEPPTPPDDDAPAGRLLPPGTEVGGYRIVELIGRGGMGVVYKAIQTSLERVVALKVLPPALAREPRFRERFDREARALAELAHPHVVAIIDRGIAGDVSYIAMEYVDGVSLRQVMAAGGLAPREALAIVPKICAALEYAHGRGIIHRDIKPENILLDRAGGVKVADFGLSLLVGPTERGRITGTNVVMGTFDYMAPEQRERARNVDHRADLYSLGVVLYEMLTGELPIGRFEPPSHRKPGVDVRLDDVVLKVLEKDPGRRYQRASEVSEAVSRASDAEGSSRMPAFAPALPVQAMESHTLGGGLWSVAKYGLLIAGIVVLLGACVCPALFLAGGRPTSQAPPPRSTSPPRPAALVAPGRVVPPVPPAPPADAEDGR